jgi:hypothetical protein
VVALVDDHVAAWKCFSRRAVPRDLAYTPNLRSGQHPIERWRPLDPSGRYRLMSPQWRLNGQ